MSTHGDRAQILADYADRVVARGGCLLPGEVPDCFTGITMTLWPVPEPPELMRGRRGNWQVVERGPEPRELRFVAHALDQVFVCSRPMPDRGTP